MPRSSLSRLSYRLAEPLESLGSCILDVLILIFVVKHLGEGVNCPGVIDPSKRLCSNGSDAAIVILESLDHCVYCFSISDLSESPCSFASDIAIVIFKRINQLIYCSGIF